MFKKKTLQLLLLTGLLAHSIQMGAQFDYVRDFFKHSNASLGAIGLVGMGVTYWCIDRLLTKFSAYRAEKAGIVTGIDSFEKNDWKSGGIGTVVNGFNQIHFIFSVLEKKEKILGSTGGWLAYNYLIRKTESAFYSQSDFGKAQKGMSEKLRQSDPNNISINRTIDIQGRCERMEINGISNFRTDMLLYRLADISLEKINNLKNDSVYLKDELNQALTILNQYS